MTATVGPASRAEGEPDEQAAFERLVIDYHDLLRSDVADQPETVLVDAARVLAEGTRRRLSGSSSPQDDEHDLQVLKELFWPEAGSPTSSPQPWTVPT